MRQQLKPIIKNILLNVLLIAVLYTGGAFFILKNNWGNTAYFFTAIVIHAVIGCIISFYNKNRLHFYNLIPILLFDITILFVFRQFNLRFIFLPISAISLYYLTGFIQIITKTSKKKNFKQIRRKYEKLHKK